MNPLVSILIPYHETPETAHLLKRAIDSVMEQTYTNYEIVLTKNGKMPINFNSAIKRARGEIIKVLCMDDYFAHKDALKAIVDNFTGTWLITGCDNNPEPKWHYRIQFGHNKLGGLSTLAFANKDPFMFDENLSWLIDCDYYYRLFTKYGLPVILNDINVCIGIHENQMTKVIPMDIKLSELEYMKNKYYDYN